MVAEPAEVRPVPPPLAEIAQRWVAAGRPAQQASRWSLGSWRQWLPEHAPFLEQLPNPINRDDVTRLCRSAGDGETDALQGFIAAMVWGYGPVGYGPFRTARVLRENGAAASTLAEAARRARSDGGVAAFEWLAGHRLHRLGVAFATKYLFFCAHGSASSPAPILDRLVRGWLAGNAALPLRLDWSKQDYRTYVDTLCGWGHILGLEPADVELLVFTLAAAGEPGSAWQQTLVLPQAGPSLRSRGDTAADGQEVLDALDLVADGFASLDWSPSDPDAEDFERGLRQLRRIILAHASG